MNTWARHLVAIFSKSHAVQSPVICIRICSCRASSQENPSARLLPPGFAQKAEPEPMGPLRRCSSHSPLSRRRSWVALPASRTSNSPGTPASSCARNASASRWGGCFVSSLYRCCPQNRSWALTACCAERVGGDFAEGGGRRRRQTRGRHRYDG